MKISVIFEKLTPKKKKKKQRSAKFFNTEADSERF